jgi:hypothetical protein
MEFGCDRYYNRWTGIFDEGSDITMSFTDENSIRFFGESWYCLFFIIRPKRAVRALAFSRFLERSTDHI